MPLQTPLKDIIYDWNPWWKNKNKIKEMTGKKRESYKKTLISFLKRKEILCLTGIRRSGKTTLMYQLVDYLLEHNSPNKIFYMNFDDERLVPLLQSTAILEDIYKTYLRATGEIKPLFVFFDEIQNINGWEKWVKRYYDTKGIKFIVTGSSSLLSQPALSTLLTGRNISITVAPLSFREFLEFKGIKTPDISNKTLEESYYYLRDKEDMFIHHLDDYLEIGGFPEAVLENNEQRRKILLQQYFKDILFRDIVSRYPIKDEGLLERFLVYLMENVTNLLSYRKISNATGTTVDTVKRYLTYVENSLLVKRSTCFTYSTKERLRESKPIKIYVTDNGIRNQVTFRFSKDFGRLAENVVFMYLHRQYDMLWYWRNKKEIDIIVGNNKTCIQVCYGEINDRELESLDEFNNNFKKILVTRDKFEMGEITKIPLWLFCLEPKMF